MSTVDGTVPTAAEVEALAVAHRTATNNATDANAAEGDAFLAWFDARNARKKATT
jgi:hypothetical protein